MNGLLLFLITLRVIFAAQPIQHNPFGEKATNHDSSDSLVKNNRFPALMISRTNSSILSVNATFGTPGQEQVLIIDTVQPFTWLNADTSEVLLANSKIGLRSVYLENDSSTSKELWSGRSYNFSLEGIDILKSSSLGSNSLTASLISDSINVTDISVYNDTAFAVSLDNSTSFRMVNYTSEYCYLSKFPFLSYTNNDSLFPTLGLSGNWSINSPLFDSFGSNDYPSFLNSIASSGLISSPSYSLWLGTDLLSSSFSQSILNHPDGVIGRLILGAVDPLYYSGNLKCTNQLPFMSPKTGKVVKGLPIVPMGAVYIQTSQKQSMNITRTDHLEPVLLDAKSPTTYLPIETVIQLAIQLNALYVHAINKWVVACSFASVDVNLVFFFNGVKISAPIKDFMSNINSTDTDDNIFFANGDQVCYLDIDQNTGIGYSVMGQNMLRSIYLVSEQDSGLIAVAAANRFTSGTAKSTSTAKRLNKRASATAARQAASNAAISSSMLTPKEISSGTIPYATFLNLTQYRYLTLVSAEKNLTDVSNLLGEFSATQSSNTILTYIRSYYSTGTTSNSENDLASKLSSFSVVQPPSAKFNGSNTSYKKAKNASPETLHPSLTIYNFFPLLISYLVVFLF